MFIRLAAPLLAVGLLSAPVFAQEQDDEISTLYDVLHLSDIVQIMREEGIAYGEEIGTDLFAGQPNADWSGIVAAIYDPARMEAEVMAALAEATEGQELGPLIEFFSTEPGKTFLDLEVSARRAMLEEEVETLAKENAALASADRTPRYQQIEQFVEVNDLIETNVAGALNASYSFYLGLMDGGAFPHTMTEDDILADVWAQEGEIRANTTEWVYSFLMLAYQPLSDADMDAYIAFSQTEEGALLNRAIFGAFDGMFEDISLSLGRAASKFMVGQEL